MNTAHTYDATLSDGAPRRAGGFRRAVETLLTWRDRARSRRMLGALDEHMLRDIGLNRGSASSEAEKPFWRP
jgi:uncharacterized protein YjiS (DUF1127 family)